MSEKSSPADNNFISALQGLRFYFLLPVFFVHCKFLATLQDGGWYSETHINAGLSVCFFFLLSGFLAAIRYRDAFSSLTWHTYSAFIRKRYMKTAFPYFLSMLWALPWWIASVDGIASKSAMGLKFLFSMSMLQTATIKYWNLFNSACWFLSCNFICYLAVPPIICRLKKKCSFRNSLFFILLSYICLLLCIAAVRILCLTNLLTEESGTLFLYVAPYVRIWYMLIGMALGSLYLNRRNSSVRFGTFSEISALLLTVGAYFFGIWSGTNKALNDLFYIPVLCILIYVFSNSHGIVSRFVSGSIHPCLGRISMYFFMFHYPLVNYGGKQLYSKLFHNSHSLFACILFLLLSLLLSATLYKAEHFFKGRKIQA